jgi:hypothetical protein
MRDLSAVGDAEFFTALITLFGAERSVGLAGWAVWWGMTGEIDNLKAVRERLQDQGLSRSAVYRALADFRRLRDYLEEKEQNIISNKDLLRRFGVAVPVQG